MVCIRSRFANGKTPRWKQRCGQAPHQTKSPQTSRALVGQCRGRPNMRWRFAERVLAMRSVAIAARQRNGTGPREAQRITARIGAETGLRLVPLGGLQSKNIRRKRVSYFQIIYMNAYVAQVPVGDSHRTPLAGALTSWRRGRARGSIHRPRGGRSPAKRAAHRSHR